MISFQFLTLFAVTYISHYVPLVNPAYTSPLKVELSSVQNSIIRAVITNQGQTSLSLLKPNSILDSLPMEKVYITHKGSTMDFLGHDGNFRMENWSQNHFILIAPNETIENDIDVSETHDLSAGGGYEIIARGNIPYSTASSTRIAGAIPYESNTLSLQIHAGTAHAPQTKLQPLTKRSRFLPDCLPNQLLNVTQAALVGARWAAAGAREALKIQGSSTWDKYFRYNDTTDMSVLIKFHNVVSIRLRNVATDLSGGIVSGIHCRPDLTISESQGNSDFCKAYPDNAIAYTYRPTCSIVLCPLMWKLQLQTNDCVGRDASDQATVMIHELTHCTALGQVGLQPPTEDFAYDFDDTVNDEFMTSGMSIQNAQTHALFAKAAHVGGPKC